MDDGVRSSQNDDDDDDRWLDISRVIIGIREFFFFFFFEEKTIKLIMI